MDEQQCSPKDPCVDDPCNHESGEGNVCVPQRSRAGYSCSCTENNFQLFTDVHGMDSCVPVACRRNECSSLDSSLNTCLDLGDGSHRCKCEAPNYHIYIRNGKESCVRYPCALDRDVCAQSKVSFHICLFLALL